MYDDVTSGTIIGNSRTHNDRYRSSQRYCKMGPNVNDPRPVELHDCTHLDTQRQVHLPCKQKAPRDEQRNVKFTSCCRHKIDIVLQFFKTLQLGAKRSAAATVVAHEYQKHGPMEIMSRFPGVKSTRHRPRDPRSTLTWEKTCEINTSID